MSPHGLGQDVVATVVDAPRPSRLHRPAVRDTNWVCVASLLYEVSSPGAGTDRSHTAGCRYSGLYQLHAPVLADRTHAPLAPPLPPRVACRSTGRLPGTGWRGVPQQRAALGEFLLAHPVGQEAEVPQPVEAVRGDVQHQAPQEFHGLERQGAQAVAALVILVAEGHLAVLQGHEPVVGDGHAMGIAGQVLEDVLGVLEGLFRVDDPLLVAHVGEEPVPGRGLGKLPTATRQGQVALRVESAPGLRGTGAESAARGRGRAGRSAVDTAPTGPIGRQAPGGQDTMEMGVMVQLLAPGVEHGEAADLRPEMLGVPGDVLEGLWRPCERAAHRGGGGSGAPGAPGRAAG